MSIRFTNTLTRQKEEFKALHGGRVSLYVCGVTVYDHCHVGHARGAVVFDVLRRYLQDRGYAVVHVRNVTDVDDKIIERARSESPGGDLKAAAFAVARRYEDSFREDYGKLGLLPPVYEPRATEYIPKMIRFIEDLIPGGYAYEAIDGVYFSVRNLGREYGRLSHQNPDQMLEGVRVEPGEGKRDPLDFALWKKAKQDEPNWPSPWGPGRPGWHIECSAMSTDLLGNLFDIHGGGQDLIFPHHENERAQALGAGKRFARYWVHNGLLTVNGQKMSKSAGNIISIQDVLKRHSADVLRMFFLGAHYKSPQDFTWERLEEAASSYDRLVGLYQSMRQQVGEGLESGPKLLQEQRNMFFTAMDDDLNTPEALAVLFGLISAASSRLQGRAPKPPTSADLEEVRFILGQVQKLAQVLGLSLASFEANDPLVEQLISERDEARKKKDYTVSDKIRDQLTEMGYIVEDTSDKTVVRKKV